MKNITASITIYNDDFTTLNRAVQSFLDTKLDVSLFLVDNSNTDVFKDKWNDERITYIFNGKNLGFGAAHNIGIKLSREVNAQYHIILNPDIYFTVGVLEALFDFMETNREVGLVLPKVLYPDGSIQYLYRLLPTPFNLFYRRFLPPGLGFLFKKSIDAYELKGLDLEKTHVIPYLSGCFMFIRTETLTETGFFDERFFLYMEDVDLSRRLLQKKKNVYYPQVTIFHEHKRASYKNLHCLKLHLLSAIKYFNKWGWFFDRERKKINRETLQALEKKSSRS